MREDRMLKIGEFARLAQVSIATLRHYDEYGLLRPAALDPDTGYRFYSLAQLPRLHQIVALKGLGFPLPQIAQLLEEDLSLEQLQAMFRLKQEHIQQIIEIEQARLARVAARLQHIEQEGNMPAHEILLKQIEPLSVAAIRKTIIIDEDLAPTYEHISAYIEKQQQRGRIPQQARTLVPPRLLLWYSRFEVHDNGIYADVELAVPLHTILPDNNPVKVRTLPGGLMACTVHPGHMLALGPAFAALHRWIAENNYRMIGPPRQLQLQLAEPAHPTSAVTELQFPVERTAPILVG